MAIPIDIVLKASGAGAVKSDLQGVTGAAQNIGTALNKVGASDALSAQSLKANGLTDSLGGAATNAGKLNSALETARNWGIGIGIAGAAAMALAKNMSDSFLEADRLGGKLESMLKGKGLGDAINQVKELGNTIAGLTGGDDDQVSAAIAGAIASGRLNGLREYGIVIDAVGQANIEAAGKISSAAKSQAILNEVLRAGATAAQNLEGGMDASTVAIGKMGVRWGNIEEGFGKGAARIQAALYDGVLSPIFDIIEASPGLQTTVGGITTIGGAALTTAGSVLALGAQVGTTAMAFPGLAAQAGLAFTGIRAGAVATYAFMAPILPLILAIGAGMIALTAAAVYYENQLKKNAEAEGDRTDRKFYDTVKGKDGARPGESFEDWKKRTGRGAENSEDKSSDPSADLAAQMDNIKKLQASMPQPGASYGAMPTIQTMAATTQPVAVSPAVMAMATPGAGSFSAPVNRKGSHKPTRKAPPGMQWEEDSPGQWALYGDATAFQKYGREAAQMQAEQDARPPSGGLHPNVQKAIAMGARLTHFKNGEDSYKLPNFDKDHFDPLQNDAEGAQLIGYLQSQKKGRGIGGIDSVIAGLLAGRGMSALSAGLTSGAASTQGAAAQTIDIPLNEHIQTSLNSSGQVVLNFVGSITLPQDSLRRAANAFTR